MALHRALLTLELGLAIPRLAGSAAEAVADAPGNGYKPLFL